jgi:stage V sporulation SpoS-like protein
MQILASAGIVRAHPRAEVQAIGAEAVNQAVKAWSSTMPQPEWCNGQALRQYQKDALPRGFFGQSKYLR